MEVTRPSDLVFYVDMNSLQGDQIGTLLTLASDPLLADMFPPEPGEHVKVQDDEGDIYDATVDVIDGVWLGVSIDWGSRVSMRPHTDRYEAVTVESFTQVISRTHSDNLVPAA